MLNGNLVCSLAALMIGGANKLQDALTIDNPIASDLDYMRPSMLANLAQAAQRNADHGADDVRLFEAGPVYPGDKPNDKVKGRLDKWRHQEAALWTTWDRLSTPADEPAPPSPAARLRRRGSHVGARR